MALLHALCVGAADVTLLIAKRAWVVTMTGSSARVLAVGVVALARLLTLPVLFVFDFSLYAWTTLATLVSTSVAAWLQRSARRAAVVFRGCNVYAAR
jgi:hypothetical protein